MKLILICWFGVIMPMLHSSSDSPINNGSLNSPAYNLNHLTPGNAHPASFQENRILIKEFADMVKDYWVGLTSSSVERIRRNELMHRVTVDWIFPQKKGVKSVRLESSPIPFNFFSQDTTYFFALVIWSASQRLSVEDTSLFNRTCFPLAILRIFLLMDLLCPPEL